MPAGKTEFELGLDLCDEPKPMRGEGGRFLPGTPSPNPLGRPKGMTNAEKMRLLLEPHREDLIGAVLNVALKGTGSEQVRALELALSRIAPPPKQEDQPIGIPGLSSAATVAEKAACIVAAVAEGHLSPERAEKVMRMLDILQRSVAIDDLRREVEALKAGRDPRVVNPAGDNE